MHQYFLLKPQLNQPLLKHGFLIDHYYVDKLVLWRLPDLELSKVYEGVCQSLACKLRDFQKDEVLIYNSGKFTLFNITLGKIAFSIDTKVHLDQLATKKRNVFGLQYEEALVIVWRDLSQPPVKLQLNNFDPLLEYRIFAFGSGNAVVSCNKILQGYFIGLDNKVHQITLHNFASSFLELEDEKTMTIAFNNGILIGLPGQDQKEICSRLNSCYKQIINQPSTNTLYTLTSGTIVSWDKSSWQPKITYKCESGQFSKMFLEGNYLMALQTQSKKLILWNIDNSQPIFQYQHEIAIIQRLVKIDDKVVCLLKNVSSMQSGQLNLINKLEIVELQKGLVLNRKELSSKIYAVDIRSLTKSNDNKLLLICKNMEKSIILSWEFKNKESEFVQRKIGNNAVIYPFNRILVPGKPQQIYSHQFKSVFTINTQNKVFLTGQNTFAIATSSQLELFQFKAGVASILHKFKLPEPIRLLEKVNWPTMDTLLKTQNSYENYYYLQGEENRWLWTQSFDIEESRQCSGKRLGKVVGDRLVSVDGVIEVWEGKDFKGIDAVWWKGKILIAEKHSCHLQLVDWQ